jgi:hypothetical protein
MIYVYVTTSGEIRRSFSGARLSEIPPESLASDEALLETDITVTDATHYVATELLQLVAFPAQPTPHHNWDWPTKSWLPDVALARAKVSAAWEAWKQRKLLDGIRVGANLWPSDERFIRRLQYYVTAFDKGQGAGPVALRTKDNGTVEVAPAAVAPLLFVIETRQENIDKQSWNGKDALKLLNTVEEIIAAGPPNN